jgi:hypothetical protein
MNKFTQTVLCPAVVVMGLALSAAAQGTNVEAIPLERGEAPPRLVVGDEIDRLEAALKLPRRFEQHKPRWRVEWRTFVFQHVNGPKESRWRVVLDGDNAVALVLSGDIHLAAFDPTKAKPRLDLPTGRYHMDHFVGPKIDTNPLLESVKEDGNLSAEEVERRRPRDQWVGSDTTLTLIRRQSTPTRDVTNRLTFSVDPVWGYRIDGVYEAAFAQPPVKVKMASHSYCPGIYIPWRENELYDYTIYTPGDGTAGKYRGWASNLYCIDRCQKLPFADPGFIAYPSQDPEGWSPVLTRSDGTGTATIGQCNAGHGPGFSYDLPALKPGADGKYRFRATRRLFAVPPEVRKHLLANTDLHQSGATGVFLRIGVGESFEDQPLDLTKPIRGLIWTSNGPKLAEGIARTGNKSLTVSGRVWPNLPQVILKPNTRYRLEGWFKVVPWSAAEIAAAKAGDQKKREALAKAGKPLPPAIDWDKAAPQAYLRGDLFEWSPHTGPMLVKQTTNMATGTQGEWEHVTLEFQTPAWDPFINISLHAENCTAYLDDFQLAPVK